MRSYCQRIGLSLTLVTTALFTTACGGGGGSSDDGINKTPIVSTSSFPLAQAVANFVSSSQVISFNISGKVNDTNASGTGTVSFGSAIADTFEGAPALSQTGTFTGNVISGSNTVPFANTGKEFYTTDYQKIGYSDADTYCVARTDEDYPTTVKVGDTASLATVDCYEDETKSTVISQDIDSYVVEADTSTSAIVNFLTNSYNPPNTLLESDQERWRITDTGIVTFVSLTTTDYTTSPATVTIFTAK